MCRPAATAISTSAGNCAATSGESGLATWLKQAIAAGVLDIADAATASRQFIALILEFALWPQLIAGEKTPNHAQRRKIIASAVKLFLDGVRK